MRVSLVHRYSSKIILEGEHFRIFIRNIIRFFFRFGVAGGCDPGIGVVADFCNSSDRVVLPANRLCRRIRRGKGAKKEYLWFALARSKEITRDHAVAMWSSYSRDEIFGNSEARWLEKLED